MVVARGQQRHERGGVGLRAGMWLHVDVIGAKEAFGAVASQVFDHVRELAAAVVAFAGGSLRRTYW